VRSRRLRAPWSLSGLGFGLGRLKPTFVLVLPELLSLGGSSFALVQQTALPLDGRAPAFLGTTLVLALATVVLFCYRRFLLFGC
jgi:hypothetical protein